MTGFRKWLRENQTLFYFVAAALLLAISIGFSGAQSDTTTSCVSVEERERIRTVVIEGIDTALKKHVIKLYDIWMKDPSSQPARAIEGMEAGISAHVRARTNALNWNPPTCK